MLMQRLHPCPSNPQGVASKLLAIRQRTSEAHSAGTNTQLPAANAPAGPSMGWYQLRAQPIVNPATDQDAILIVQQDVTERVGDAAAALLGWWSRWP